MRFTHQALHGLGDAQQNFEQLESLTILDKLPTSFLQLLSTQTLQINAGTVGITFSASQSGSGTISHNIGRVPLCVLLTWQLNPGSAVVLGADTFTTTQATAHGWNAAALTGTFNASWLAIG